MSYSFNVQVASKREALDQATFELAKVVTNQPIHAQDFAHARKAIEGMIATLADDPSKDVALTVSGSVSYDWANRISSASVQVNASLVVRVVVAGPAPA
jgi:hypothetical protein